MKQLFFFFFLFLCLSFGTLSAQITAAKVTYQESTALDFANDEDMDPGMKALFSQLPDALTVNSELLFNESAASYSTKRESQEDLSAEQGDRKITFQISQGEPDVFYVDLKNNITKQQRSIFDRSFQIEDEIAPIDWTITDETETDAKSTLPVKKAIGITAQGDTLTAWYTNSIPVSTGPRTFGGLPGLIVRLIDGETTFQLTHIELLAERPDIPLPFEGGKTITLKKYYDIQDKKMEAFQTSGSARIMRFGGD